MKDRDCILNLDEYKSVEIHSIALYASGNIVTYCDSFDGFKKVIGKKNIKTNIQITGLRLTKRMTKCKNVFAFLFIVHKIISLTRHEQDLMNL